MSRRSKGIVGALAIALLTTMAVNATPAGDATTPPWEPADGVTGLSLGSLSLFSAAGTPITGGNLTDSPMIAYSVASGTTSDTGVNKVGLLQVATPDGTPDTSSWVKDTMGSATAYPNPADPAAVRASGNPYASSVGGDFSLSDYISLHPNTRVDAYAGLYQVRVYTPSTQLIGVGKYFSVDIQVTGSTWQVIYPAPAVNHPTTTVVSTPTASGPGTSDIALTATVTNNDSTGTPAGTVTFKEGSTVLATDVPLNGAGVATTTVIGASLSFSAHTLSAEYTPSAGFLASSGSTSYTVTMPAPANLAAPSLSGSLRVGGIATCSPGTWTYSGAYRFAFYRGVTEIQAPSTTTTRTLVLADFGQSLTCRVTAINSVGSTTVASAAVKVAAGAAPVATVKPKITGVFLVGKKLLGNRGTWTGPPTSYKYVWKRGTAIVKQGTTSAYAYYVTTKLDKGKVITLTISALRTGYLTGAAVSLPHKIG
jgi:hypothetical protein